MLEIGEVMLVGIDPMTSYMGLIDAYRTTDVRSFSSRCQSWRRGTMSRAIIGISHPPKAAQAKAIHAVTGSLRLSDARLVFLVVEEF